MKANSQALGLLILAIAATGAMGDNVDDSAPLLCAATRTLSCGPVGDCFKRPADAFNLPVFMKFDLQKKEVVTAKESAEPRTSKILEVNDQDDVVMLVGIDPAGSWSGAIDKTRGELTLSITLNGTGYLVFGSCIER